MSDSRREDGMRVRREVLGDAYVDAAVAGTTPFSSEFQDFITRVAWGDVWSRPGIDRRTRSLMNLSMIAALNRPDELHTHVRGAIQDIGESVSFLADHGDADTTHVAALKEALLRIDDPADGADMALAAALFRRLYPRFFPVPDTAKQSVAREAAL